MVKIVTFFLIAIMILAMIGRLKMPKVNLPKRKKKVEQARKCEGCGSYILNKGPCACGHKPKKKS
jgi:hypothetical protein